MRGVAGTCWDLVSFSNATPLRRKGFLAEWKICATNALCKEHPKQRVKGSTSDWPCGYDRGYHTLWFTITDEILIVKVGLHIRPRYYERTGWNPPPPASAEAACPARCNRHRRMTLVLRKARESSTGARTPNRVLPRTWETPPCARPRCSGAAGRTRPKTTRIPSSKAFGHWPRWRALLVLRRST